LSFFSSSPIFSPEWIGEYFIPPPSPGLYFQHITPLLIETTVLLRQIFLYNFSHTGGAAIQKKCKQLIYFKEANKCTDLKEN
jgi:hypothetical protein